MSRAERWAKMGEDAWDEPYTPEDIADFRRRGQPVPQRSPIPGVIRVIPPYAPCHSWHGIDFIQQGVIPPYAPCHKQRSPIPGVIIIPKQEESHGQRHS